MKALTGVPAHGGDLGQRHPRAGTVERVIQPQVVIAGRYRGDELVMVGRTVPSARRSRPSWVLLYPAPTGHPWTDEISSQRWRQGHEEAADQGGANHGG